MLKAGRRSLRSLWTVDLLMPNLWAALRRRFVLYDVKRQLAGALLDVPFKQQHSRNDSHGACICVGAGRYVARSYVCMFPEGLAQGMQLARSTIW